MDAFLGVLTTRHPMFKTSEHVAALVSLRGVSHAMLGMSRVSVSVRQCALELET